MLIIATRHDHPTDHIVTLLFPVNGEDAATDRPSHMKPAGFVGGIALFIAAQEYPCAGR